MSKLGLGWLCWLWMGMGLAYGQSSAKIKRQADRSFEEARYQQALLAYQKVKDKYTKDLEVKYRMGVCYFHLGSYDQSIDYLTFYTNNNHKPESRSAYYLAKAHHYLNAFDYAAQYYKVYLRTLDKDDPERANFKRLILQCTAGTKIEQINSRAIVTPLGAGLNSPFDDYRLRTYPSAVEQIFFSSNRPLLDSTRTDANIYQSALRQGSFTAPLPLSARYNTSLGEELVSFFDGGYQLLLLKTLPDGQTRLFCDNYDQDSIEVLLPFADSSLGSTAWDGDHFFVNDSLVIFASDREGGYGGRDLYYALRKNGIWKQPKNLGPTLNTPYDEISPFLSRNGAQLYFSSNRPTSMGGYDIFRGNFDGGTARFISVENVGIPLNSSGDDRDLWLSDDGSTAYLASNRTGGLGGLDLYSVYFRTPVEAQQTEGLAFVFPLQEKKAMALVLDTNTIAQRPVLEPNTPRMEKEEYSLSPIYYSAETGQLQGARNTLISLEKLLLRYPQIRVVLSAHSNNDGDKSTDLFLTVKQAEVVAQRLIRKGVRPEQLYLRGCSQYFPLANDRNFDGSANPVAGQINQRIQLTVYNQDQLPEGSLTLVEPNVNSVMRNHAAERYAQDLQGLSYKVELTQATTPLQHEILQVFSPITTEKTPQALAVTYYVGLDQTFADSYYLLTQLKEAGFDQARVVAYMDGFPLSNDDAQVRFTDYPDLSAYLEYLAGE